MTAAGVIRPSVTRIEAPRKKRESRAVDHAHQRRVASLWDDLQQLIDGSNKAGLAIDRKVLAELSGGA